MVSVPGLQMYSPLTNDALAALGLALRVGLGTKAMPPRVTISEGLALIDDYDQALLGIAGANGGASVVVVILQ